LDNKFNENFKVNPVDLFPKNIWDLYQLVEVYLAWKKHFLNFTYKKNIDGILAKSVDFSKKLFS